MTAAATGFTGLTGRIVRADDADYAAAAAGWNLLFDHRPAVIAFTKETADVVNAVAWARQHDVPVRIRSGRHCLEGWSSIDDGIVIDVSEMKSVTIDTASHTATVGAGLDQAEAVAALGAAGVAAPTGTEGSVGLVGATLGGGFGLLTRMFGMACDNLIAAEVVVASGASGAEAIVVDAESDADLLWALRGAGNGNFGVVTSLTYTVHPLAETVYVTATWPNLADLREVFQAWQQSAPHADHRLTSQLEINREQIVLVGVLASGTEAEATRLLAPVISVGAPQVTTTNGSWPETYAAFQIPTADEPANWKFLSQFVSEPFPSEAIDVIAEFLSKAPTSGCNYFTNAFGGAVVDGEPGGGAAFAHRDALFYAEPGAGWGTRGGVPAAADPLTAPCRSWVLEFGHAMARYVDGAYANVPNADMVDWEAAYWGPSAGRLRTVKSTYDPTNVFTFEQSVPPSPPTPCS
jgi:FAD/FMN-containing dehydrogenase